MSDIDKVISVCAAKDLPVWMVTATEITKFIDAKRYVCIVPDRDINQFKRFTPNTIEVIGESVYTDSIKKLLETKFNDKNKGRYGWYLQQFIKLSALAEAEPNEIYLIWDADTIPLKPLAFTSGEQLIFYRGSGMGCTEHHLPYFKMIDRLLGLKKLIPDSFIAQCLAVKGKWIRDFILFIESKHKIPWLEAIIQTTNFDELSGFSEYETLGTFFFHKYPTDLIFLDNKWLRFGNSAIGGVKNLEKSSARFMLRHFDFASFEVWDVPLSKVQIAKQRIPLSIKTFIKRLIGKS